MSHWVPLLFVAYVTGPGAPGATFASRPRVQMECVSGGDISLEDQTLWFRLRGARAGSQWAVRVAATGGTASDTLVSPDGTYCTTTFTPPRPPVSGTAPRRGSVTISFARVVPPGGRPVSRTVHTWCYPNGCASIGERPLPSDRWPAVGLSSAMFSYGDVILARSSQVRVVADRMAFYRVAFGAPVLVRVEAPGTAVTPVLRRCALTGGTLSVVEPRHDHPHELSLLYRPFRAGVRMTAGLAVVILELGLRGTDGDRSVLVAFGCRVAPDGWYRLVPMSDAFVTIDAAP